MQYTIGGGFAYAIAVSPDGRSVAIGGESGHVYLADRTTGERRWTGRFGSGAVQFCRFSPDSRLLVVGAAGVHVVRCQNGHVVHRYPRGGVGDAAFDATGSKMAFVRVVRPSDDSALTIVDTDTWEPIAEHLFEGYPPQALSYRVEPEAWIVGGNGGGVRAVTPGGDVELLYEHHADKSFHGSVKALGWIDGKLSSASWSGEVFVGEHRHKRHRGLYHAAFSPQGDRCATYSPKDGLRIWDAHGEHVVVPEVAPTAIGFAPDGALAMATNDCRLRWFEDGKLRDGFAIDTPSRRARRLAFSRDGEFLASSSNATSVVELKTGVRRMLPVMAREIFPGRAGTEFLIFTAGSVAAIDARTLKTSDRWASFEIAPLDDATRNLCGAFGLASNVGLLTRSAGLSPDGILAIGEGLGIEGDMGKLIVRTADGELLFDKEYDAWIVVTSFSPSGKSLVVAHGTGGPTQASSPGLYRFDAATMRLERGAEVSVHRWHHLDDDLAIAVESNFETSNGDFTVSLALWNARDLERIEMLREEDFDRFAISPDRRWIAISVNERVTVYEVERTR